MEDIIETHLSHSVNANMYGNLKPAHKRKLLDAISLDIPLKVVTDLIEDGVYWKRKCQVKWSLCDVSHYGNSWKRMFFERNLENIIEHFIPEKTDRTCLEDTLIVSAPYVERLIITQLLPPINTEPKVVLRNVSLTNILYPGDQKIMAVPIIQLYLMRCE